MSIATALGYIFFGLGVLKFVMTVWSYRYSPSIPIENKIHSLIASAHLFVVAIAIKVIFG